MQISTYENRGKGQTSERDKRPEIANFLMLMRLASVQAASVVAQQVITTCYLFG